VRDDVLKSTARKQERYIGDIPPTWWPRCAQRAPREQG
jgi:hypothetical protein